ncbi:MULTISPECIES: hypothetical protein [unclassified Pantoea]|uniref:hypothetical protein n=1 Tax=unclassified Pantoea TaxID=2630326 RepID=UPI0012E05C33|nr:MULTISPECIES: hypothetical protein [unclassified Pantoea]
MHCDLLLPPVAAWVCHPWRHAVPLSHALPEWQLGSRAIDCASLNQKGVASRSVHCTVPGVRL